MQFEFKYEVQSYYKLVATNIHTGKERVVADWFPNLITNAGLDYFGKRKVGNPGDNQPFKAVCCVGSGNNAPAVGNTALQTLVAATGVPTNNGGIPDQLVEGTSSAAPWYWFTRPRCRFPAGFAGGNVNISEVGVGPHQTALFSRALVLDNLGAPTTVSVLVDEILDVYWEFRVYFSTADIVTNITIDGVPTTCTYRICAINELQQQETWGIGQSEPGFYAISMRLLAPPVTLGAVTNYPTSAFTFPGQVGGEGRQSGYTDGYTGETHVTQTVQPYTNGTYYRDLKYSLGPDEGIRIGLSEANKAYYAGIGGACFFTNRGWFQCKFEPAIAKTANKRLDFTVRVSWARRP